MLDSYDKGKKERAQYQPNKAVTEQTLKDKKLFARAAELQRKSFPEFNSMSVLARQEQNQKIFNLYEDPEPTDEDLKWRSRYVRTGSRDAVIGIAAHLISAMMYPNFHAQNDDDDEDKDAASVMRDMVLWNIENSDYEMSMLFGIIAAAVNPAMYMGVDYAEALQSVRQDFEGKDISAKEVLDTVISGLHVDPIPMEEILPTNFYQYSHQRQPTRIRKRYISMDEFEARWGDHKHAKFVRPGVQTVFDETENRYYSVDEGVKSDDMLEWVNIQTRRGDEEVDYVNGVYFGADTVTQNPMKHRRLMNVRGEMISVPLYPEAKTGYEPIDEKRFYYYKSVIDKVLPNHKRFQKMARLVEDGTVLSVLKPVLQSGKARINQSVVFPAGVTSLPEGSKVEFMDIGANLSAVYQNMVQSEQEMSRSSQDEIRQGSSSKDDRTAYEISRTEANAIVKEFAIFGRMIGTLVEDVGELMSDCIIHHQTLGEVEEVAGMGRLKTKKFLLNNQSREGRRVTKKIMFTDEYMGRSFTPDELEEESWNVYREQQEQGDDVELYKVNPYVFARRRYLAVCDIDNMMPKSMGFEEDRKLRAAQLLSTSPYADREAVERDFLFDPLTEGKSDKYMLKGSQLGIVPGMPTPTAPTPGAPKQNPQPVQALPETGVV